MEVDYRAMVRSWKIIIAYQLLLACFGAPSLTFAQCPKSIKIAELSTVACSCTKGQVIDIILDDGTKFPAKTSHNATLNEVYIRLGRRDLKYSTLNGPLNGPGAVLNTVVTLFPHEHALFIKKVSKHFVQFRILTDLEASFDLRQGEKHVDFYTISLINVSLEEGCINATYPGLDEKSKLTLVHGRMLYCQTYGSPNYSSCGKCFLPSPNQFSEKFITRAIKINSRLNSSQSIKSQQIRIPSRYTIKVTYYDVLLRIGLCNNVANSISKRKVSWPKISGTLTPIKIRTDSSDLEDSEEGANKVKTTTESNVGDNKGPSAYRECGVSPIYNLGGRGRSKPPANYRLIGGQPAEPNYYAWQVAIFRDIDEFLCGGTILYPGIILTAAHCFLNDWRPSQLKNIRVRVGKHNIKEKEKSQQTRRVEKLIMHENFNKFEIDYKNDIALLILRKPIKFNKYTVRICYDKSYLASNFDSNTCYITGWGDTRENNVVLNHLKIPIVPLDVCNSKKYMNKRVKEGMFCAGYIQGTKDACQGDSGGPLQCFNDNDGKWYIVGIISWGEACAQPNKLGVYTDVKYFIPWIDRKLKENDLTPDYFESLI